MADLAALLDKEASAEIEAIHSEARARASEIVAKAQEDAAALVSQRERAAAQQHEAALVRSRSSAQLEASSMKLRAQQEAIESVFREATQRIDALTGNPAEYGPVLTKLLQEALAAVGANASAVTVHVAPADEKLARDALAKLNAPAARVEANDAVKGGVRLKGGANTSVENTLYGRLAALRDDLASEVARTLQKKGA